MNVSVAILRALPLTLLLFVVEAVFAVFAALPLTLELGRHPFVRAISAADRAALLDLLLALVPAFRVANSSALIAFGCLLLLGPWLQMSWLSVLDRPLAISEALRAGARRTLQAWLVSILVLLTTCLLALPFVILAFAFERFVGTGENERAHDLTLLACLAPVALVLTIAFVLHDLARASALRRNAFASVASALRNVLRPSVLMRALAYAVVGHALVVASQLAATRFSHASSGPLVEAALLQSALFARLVTRSAWLASALACVASSHEAGVGAFEREQ